MNITIKNLTLQIGDKKIFDNINFVFKSGFINKIQGKNGSGKTSLLKCILGIFNDYTGSVLIDDTELTKENQQEMIKKFSFLIEQKMLYKNLSVSDNIEIFKYYYGIKKLEPQLSSLYNNFELNNYENEKSDKLSEGFQKKLSIILSLMNNTDCIVLDEPYNFLDASSISHLNSYLNLEIKNNNRTVILSTHQEYAFDNINLQILNL